VGEGGVALAPRGTEVRVSGVKGSDSVSYGGMIWTLMVVIPKGTQKFVEFAEIRFF
jgi:hypothetical protein